MSKAILFTLITVFDLSQNCCKDFIWGMTRLWKKL